MFSQTSNDVNRTIDSLIDLCRSSNKGINEKVDLAVLAKSLAIEANEDSLIVKANRTLSLMYIASNDFDSFVLVNKENLELAPKIKDSFSTASAFANLGSYQRYLQQNDSAFYYLNNSLKYFSSKEISTHKAQSLYWRSELQQVFKIYESAEVDAIKALEILGKLDRSEEVLDLTSSVYNVLAIISKDLGEHETAIEYYKNSISYANKMLDGYINVVYAQYNIANAYTKLGKYDLALEILDDLKIKKSSYENEDASFYGSILQAIANAQVASGTYEFTAAEASYKTAYELCVADEYEGGALSAYLDLSDLYFKEQLTDSVLKYGKKSLEMANAYALNDGKQRALYLLSQVTLGEAGKAYLREHIRLEDSLDARERSVRNKIARIKFDTDQIQARNEQISKENLYLIIVTIALLFSGALIYVILSQRARNRQLRLKQAQQEANEEIYNLMLSQQDKIEEARSTEKIRVSKELHDGILGRLFGVRLSLDSLNFSEGKDAALNRGNYINQLKGIEEDIRTISHEMNADFISGSGFTDILKELIDNQSLAYGLTSSFHFTDDINWDKLSNKIKINLYRIVQESMQNIYKHAKASRFSVGISLINNDICLEVTDDGQGFDVKKQRQGIGLKNISSRINEVNGTSEFQSKLGAGTTLRVFVPGDQL